jgi:glycosyltransferase involved in cell wall biosynthesis
MSTELTIGMATYNDFNGVYFSVQSLRLYQDLRNVELLVVDNADCAQTRQFIEGWVHNARYLRYTERVGTAAPRDLVFREAGGDAVLCIDCHVLLVPGAVARLKQYYREHPTSRDLLQGPMLYDDLTGLATHFEPVWREQMWGIWSMDERGKDMEAEPFDIPMQGLGLFSSRKDAWPGFHPGFRGFGGEEGYIHEKFRQRGGRCVCLPWLRWAHRFARPGGAPFPLLLEDRLHNYLVGHAELGLSLRPVVEHFLPYLGRERLLGLARLSLGRELSPEELPAAAADSNLGKWDPWFEGVLESRPFGGADTYERGASFLQDVHQIEDWGCGLGWFRRYLRSDQQYRGIDGSRTPFADVLADLVQYHSDAEAVVMRHVLEHDHQWETILLNALHSFRRKMVLIFFTPFGESTRVLHEETLGPGRVVPFYSFRKEDITGHFDGLCRWREERAGDGETIFYLWK